jgi:hypothetical protein
LGIFGAEAGAARKRKIVMAGMIRFNCILPGCMKFDAPAYSSALL